MKKFLKFAFNKKRGIAMVDYVLIVSLVTVIGMASIQQMSDVLFTQQYSQISSAIDRALSQHEMEMLDLENRQNIQAYGKGQIIPGAGGGGVLGGGTNVIPGDFSGDYVGNVDSEGGQTTQGGQYGTIEDHNTHLPEAKFKVSKNPVGVGIPVEILNISTDPKGCRIVKVDWGGTYPANNTWTLDGTYELKLRVADEYGNWSNWYKETIVVTNDPPEAKLTSKPDFDTLTGKDEDMISESNTEHLFLKVDEEQKIHLYDTASFDPDGHKITTSYWTLNNNSATKDFGEGLHPEITQSGTYTATLKVKDKYNKVSEVETKTFFVFASERPVINNIRISDGSNGELSEENIDPESWSSEVFPYHTGESPKLPANETTARLSFDATDDSPAITAYQLKVNGQTLNEQQITILNKTNNDFYLGSMLNIASLNVSGTANIAFRIKDSTGTWSYWTDDISVEFIDVNNYVPEISNVILTNYSHYTNSPVQEASPYYTGTFLAEVKLEDPYGNTRSVSNFDMEIAGENIIPDNVIKVSGNRYKIYFTYLKPQTGVPFTIAGQYGTGIVTNTYEIQPITIKETKLTFNASIKNSQYPDWWTVSLTGNSATEISVETEESGNSAGLQFNVNYTTKFKAHITEVHLKLNGIEHIYPVDNDNGSGSFTSIRNFASSEFPDGDVTMSMRIKDDMGMYSDWSSEKTFKSLKIATYVPTIESVKIEDYRGQSNNNRKRGPLTVEILTRDFFSIFRDPTSGTFVVSDNGTQVPDAFNVTEIKKINNKQQKVIGTIDATNWLTQKGESKTFTYTASAEYTYPSGKTTAPYTNTFKVSTYNPHVIKKVEYEPNQVGSGTYIITYEKSKDDAKFNITKVNLDVRQINPDGTTSPINHVGVPSQATIEPHPTNSSYMLLKIPGPQIPSHVEIPIKVYFEHNELTADSAIHNDKIIIYKPHNIIFKDATTTMYHRGVNTEIDGYSKRFGFTNLITPETAPETIDFDFTLYYTDKDGVVNPYKTFKHVDISPKGALVFSGEGEIIEAEDAKNRVPSSYTNVISDDFGINTFSFLNGNYYILNTADKTNYGFTEKSGIYSKTLTASDGTRSLSIKYIDVCKDFDTSTNYCNALTSFEVILYENGSAIMRYDSSVGDTSNISTVGARISEDGEDIAYGQLLKQSLAGKTIIMNTPPTTWKLPPYIYKIEYTQADRPDSITNAGEVQWGNYTVYYKNPDNATISGLEAKLTQRKKNETSITEEPFTTTASELTFDIPGENISFDSQIVVLRGSTDIILSARLIYDETLYSEWYYEDEIKYIGPVKVGFEILDDRYHMEPTNDVTGYTYQPIRGCSVGVWCDDKTTSFIPLGFEMNYFGTKVDTISVSTNSLIRFRTPQSTGYVQNDWNASPVESLENDTIALLWYDQDFNGLSDSISSPCGIWTKSVPGANGTSYMSIKFVNMTMYKKGTERFTYEVRLYESGRVVVHYSGHTPVKFSGELNNPTNANTTIAFKRAITSAYGSLIYPFETSTEFNMDDWSRLFARYAVSKTSYAYFPTVLEPEYATGHSLEFDLDPDEEIY